LETSSEENYAGYSSSHDSRCVRCLGKPCHFIDSSERSRERQSDVVDSSRRKGPATVQGLHSTQIPGSGPTIPLPNHARWREDRHRSRPAETAGGRRTDSGNHEHDALLASLPGGQTTNVLSQSRICAGVRRRARYWRILRRLARAVFTG